jgi:hypothetical protein
MKMDFAIFATHATIRQDGVFSLLDGGIAWIEAYSFPAVCLNLSVLAKFAFAPAECGHTYECILKVKSPDGNTLEPKLSVMLNPVHNKRHPENPSSFTAHYLCDRFYLEGAGFYHFAFYVGDLCLGEVSLEGIEHEHD